ncbi:MAG: hypothetical protein IJC86_04560 [Clostridia bacterium]|nr:hypothetical protein [Clostridia bacterium]
MKRDYSKVFFSVGLLLLVAQLLIIIFNIINGTADADVQFAVEEKITFLSFIHDTWGSLLGTIMLVVLFMRRINNILDPLLTLAGGLLWIVQIISLYDSGAELLSFLLRYIIGILGILLIFITAYRDFRMTKSTDKKDE